MDQLPAIAEILTNHGLSATEMELTEPGFGATFVYWSFVGAMDAFLLLLVVHFADYVWKTLRR